MITTINDRVEALVHFQNGRLKPIRFLWKHQPYHIDNITTVYQTKNGGVQNLNFAVESKGNIYQLSYNSSDHTWTLTKIFTDG